MNYYNEFDPFAAAWLQVLMDERLIPIGKIDTRSITEVSPDDLKGFTQCHFFAGIGGWSLALQIAGWPTTEPVWTGSCPCQPFSSAGKKKGKADERHLWPVWFGLIRQQRPPVLFGEQVASAIAHRWLDDVYQGLEAEGYAVGAAVLPACGAGAPHRRDRLFFVGHGSSQGSQRRRRSGEQQIPEMRERTKRHTWEDGVWIDTQSGEGLGTLGDTDGKRRCKNRTDFFRPTEWITSTSFWNGGQWLDCADRKQRLVEPSIRLLANGIPNRVGRLRGYGNAIVAPLAAEFIKAYMEIEA